MAKKDTKDRSVFVRFNEETSTVLDRIKRIFGERGEATNDAEIVRRLIGEGASRIEARSELGLHEDLEQLQQNPRLSLLNIQVRQRAGEWLTRAELIFLSTYLLAVYRHDGVRRREWVRKDPIVALFHVLYSVAQLQARANNTEVSEQDTEFFQRWGRTGMLTLSPTARSQGWASAALAQHICQMLATKVEAPEPIDMRALDLDIPRTEWQSLLRSSIYGYWTKHQSTVLDDPSAEPVFPVLLQTGMSHDFRVDPIQSGNRFGCSITKSNQWIFAINSWIEWRELNEVIAHSLEGSLDARAGRFTLYSPMVDSGYILEITGVRLCFERSEFTNFCSAIELANNEHAMLALTERFKDVYGEI